MGFSELGVIVFTRTKPNPSFRDTNSLRQLIVLVISLALGIGWAILPSTRSLLVITSHSSTVLRVTALLILILSLVLRWVSILTLKQYFSANLTIQKDHKIIQQGIYSVLRHPSYTGVVLSFLALGLSFNSYPSLVLIFLPNLIMILIRIEVEEKILFKNFPEEYPEYARKTRKLLPFIY